MQQCGDIAVVRGAETVNSCLPLGNGRDDAATA